MSLAVMASATNYSKGHLSKVENGRTTPHPAVLAAYDRVLDAGGELVGLAETDVEQLMGLPECTPHFVGRTPELAELTAALTGIDRTRTCVVSGLAGAGKTTLAVAAAHQVRAYYPDGCLFFDPHSYSPGLPRLEPADAAHHLLRSLGVPGDRIPTDTNGRLNVLRSTLSGRCLLLVLDNVRDAGQVRQLLPAERGCGVIITSRSQLPALDDARHVTVGVLDRKDAVALFSSISSVVADEDAEAIVRYCGLLPLAIRIAAARLACGGWTTDRLRARLARDSSRLTALDDGERSIAAAFKVSYDMLSTDQRMLFGLLALHPGPIMTAAALEALADVDIDEIDETLDRLHDAHLVTRTAEGDVKVHDLVLAFAVRFALPEIEPEERQAAVHRLIDHALATLVAADELVEPQRFRPAVDCAPLRRPPFAAADDALAWLKSQWQTLVGVVELATDDRPCWQLAYVLRGFFFREKLIEPWIDTHIRTLVHVESSGDRVAAGMILNNLGMAHIESGDLNRAADCHRRARECFAEVGDERGEIDALSSLAWVRLHQDEPADALRDLTTVLAVYRRQHRDRNTMIALRGTAFALAALGRHDDAQASATEAGALARLLVDTAMCLNCLGWIAHQAGRFDDARRHYEEAAAMAEQASSSYECVRALTGLGNTAAQGGDQQAADEWWAAADEAGAALTIFVLREADTRRAWEEARSAATARS
jgi:tetratricopeptide (TPR) repeat protein